LKHIHDHDIPYPEIFLAKPFEIWTDYNIMSYLGHNVLPTLAKFMVFALDRHISDLTGVDSLTTPEITYFVMYVFDLLVLKSEIDMPSYSRDLFLYIFNHILNSSIYRHLRRD